MKHQIIIEDIEKGEVFRQTLASQTISSEDYSKKLEAVYKDLKLHFEVQLNNQPVRITKSLEEAIEKYNSI